MASRLEQENTEIVEPYRCDDTAIAHFLEDKAAIASLMAARESEHWTENGMNRVISQHLTPIFFLFQPVADRLIQKRIRQFPNLHKLTEPEELKADILATQGSQLWQWIIKDFDWQRYSNSQHATGAFVKYLVKATGSFFAEEIIHLQHRESHRYPRAARRDEYDRYNSAPRPVEETVIQREKSRLIEQALTKWRQSTSPCQMAAVVGRYIHGQSSEEMAEQKHVKSETMERRLIRGKKSLHRAFKSCGLDDVDIDGIGYSRALLLNHESRASLLAYRRSLLLKQYPIRKNQLDSTPRLQQAVVVFYGLDGNDPVYDYEITAEILDISPSAARVHVSRGVRLLLSQNGTQPSPATLRRCQEKDLYHFWQYHSPQIRLSPEQTRILKDFYENGLPHHAIAKDLGVGEETVRRRRIAALTLIRIHQSK